MCLCVAVGFTVLSQQLADNVFSWAKDRRVLNDTAC